MSHPSVITIDQVGAAISDVERLGSDAKIERLESIGKLQLAVTGAVVRLTRMGVDYPTLDHAFHVLLVLHACFIRDVPSLSEISLDMFENAMRNNFAMLELLGKETPKEARRLGRATMESYPEQSVLAFVTGYLTEQGISKFSRENELVLRVCRAIMDSFVEAMWLASQPDFNYR